MGGSGVCMRLWIICPVPPRSNPSRLLQVVSLDPPPRDLTKVRTIVEWGWGQMAGEMGGYQPSTMQHFTRHKTAAHWAKM
jgi:hypothetical protein